MQKDKRNKMNNDWEGRNKNLNIRGRCMIVYVEKFSKSTDSPALGVAIRESEEGGRGQEQQNFTEGI